MPDDNGVGEAIAAMMAARQAEQDRGRVIFDHAMSTAVPKPEDLHNALLFNMTTRPKWNPMLLALTWMQSDPNEWTGMHPEVCQNIAKLFGLGVDV